jgi:cytochrome c556
MRIGRGMLAIAIVFLCADTAPAQTARTAPMMREKLVHAQAVLEALTTSNFDLLGREAAALSRIAQSPRWSELKTKELRVPVEDFLKAVNDLDAAAKRRDLDGAAASYGAMVGSCYQCHRRLKDLRIAR